MLNDTKIKAARPPRSAMKQKPSNLVYLSDTILPPGATHRIHNRLFKIGAHNLVYKWSQGYQEWLRCNFEIDDLIGFEIRPSRGNRYV